MRAGIQIKVRIQIKVWIQIKARIQIKVWIQIKAQIQIKVWIQILVQILFKRSIKHQGPYSGLEHRSGSASNYKFDSGSVSTLNLAIKTMMTMAKMKF